jgi:2-dehydro-3-deoxygluconokinase
MASFVTFGEIMARLSPPGFLRLAQMLPGSLDVIFAGAEANVAASLALLGAPVRYVTALPDNALGDACIASLRGLGIDSTAILRVPDSRIGLFFVEAGANQRPSRVTYDRKSSALSATAGSEYAWADILAGADWLHVSGITPAVSRAAADATIAAVTAAQAAGVAVSCDLNYRAKLWLWDASVAPRELARQVMAEILPHVDLLVANEEDCEDVIGIRAGHSDVQAGSVDVAAYPEVGRQVCARFPNIKRVAITLRESVSASHNNWGAMLYQSASDTATFAPERDGEYQPYEIRNIVDRVGAGDAFAAGLMFALTTADYATPAAALRFATAASCLAHSVSGDFNFASRDEIDALAEGSASGRVAR